FCLISGGVYLANDLRDLHRDRLHVGRSLRPLAAGQLSPRLATVTAAGLVVVGLVGSLLLDPWFGLIAFAYILLQVAYTFGLKHEVVLDVMVIAAGFVYCLTTPAPYVLMLGVLLQLIFGWPLIPALLVGTILSSVYVFFGGFRSDVRVNIVQFVLMFVGFAVILPYCYWSLGGFTHLKALLPATHLTWNGGNSPGYVIAWFFIALWTLVDPGFHQRCYAAKDPKTAQRGVLISILFWVVFDFMTCTAGLYARAALPDIEPVMAYPLLAEKLLPAGVKGLFYVAMLATVMSTLVSYLFLSGVTFTRDFVWRLEGGDPDDRLNLRTVLGLTLTTVIALVLAILVPSVVKLWYAVGTTFIPGLLLPLLSAYWPKLRVRRKAAGVLMILASLTSLLWLLWGQLHQVDGFATYPLGLEPMYPGLIVSVVGFVVAKRRKIDESVAAG
ncbi:MAG: UbiA family prenyltransferase, partial [Armatimonadota bacterium]